MSNQDNHVGGNSVVGGAPKESAKTVAVSKSGTVNEQIVIVSCMSDDQIWDVFEALHKVAEGRGWLMRAFSAEQLAKPAEDVWDAMIDAARDDLVA